MNRPRWPRSTHWAASSRCPAATGTGNPDDPHQKERPLAELTLDSPPAITDEQRLAAALTLAELAKDAGVTGAALADALAAFGLDEHPDVAAAMRRHGHELPEAHR